MNKKCYRFVYFITNLAQYTVNAGFYPHKFCKVYINLGKNHYFIGRQLKRVCQRIAQVSAINQL